MLVLVLLVFVCFVVVYYISFLSFGNIGLLLFLYISFWSFGNIYVPLFFKQLLKTDAGWLVGWLLQTAHFVDFGGCDFLIYVIRTDQTNSSNFRTFLTESRLARRKFILLRGGIRQIRVDYWGNH